MGQGILVDAEGHFLGAFRWPENEPAPKASSFGKGPEGGFKLLQDIDPPKNPSGKWDFRAKVWTYPTEKRWIVRQRRDIPDLWFLSGVKFIWPNRLPRLPEGTVLVGAPPPDLGGNKKPIWDETLGDWRSPRRVALLDPEGVITGFVSSYRDDDLPPHDSFIEVSSPLEGLDALGKPTQAQIGDRVTFDELGKTKVDVRRPPRFATYEEAIHVMVSWINDLTEQVEGDHARVLALGWEDEKKAAEAYLAGVATDEQLADLGADADAKGRSKEEQARAVLRNSAEYKAMISEVRRMSLSTKAALAKVVDPFEYERILEVAKEQAAAQAAQMGLTV